MKISVTGTLPIGFEYAGALVKEFEARPAKLADSVAAIEAAGADASALRQRIALNAQIVRFKDVAEADHKADLLLSLWEKDYEVVQAAIDEAEKKLVESSSSLTPSEEPKLS